MGSKRIRCTIEVDGQPLCEIGSISEKIRFKDLAKCTHKTRAEAKRFVAEVVPTIPILEGRTVVIREHRDGQHDPCPGCRRRGFAELDRIKDPDAEYALDRPGRPRDDGAWTVRKWHDWITRNGDERSPLPSASTPVSKLRGAFHKDLRETHLSEVTDDQIAGWLDQLNDLDGEAHDTIPSVLMNCDLDPDTVLGYLAGEALRLTESILSLRERIVQVRDLFHEANRLQPPTHVDVYADRRSSERAAFARIVWCDDPSKDRRGNENWNRPYVDLDLSWNPYEGSTDADLIREVRDCLDAELFARVGVEVRVHSRGLRGSSEVGRLTTGWC